MCLNGGFIFGVHIYTEPSIQMTKVHVTTQSQGTVQLSCPRYAAYELAGTPSAGSRKNSIRAGSVELWFFQPCIVAR
jgi:hypothetical protein